MKVTTPSAELTYVSTLERVSAEAQEEREWALLRYNHELSKIREIHKAKEAEALKKFIASRPAASTPR